MEERDWVEEPLQALSYGGGTQSSAMLLFIADGKLPKPDLVIHADTGAEMPETVELIDNWARDFTENVLNIPFVIVTSHRGTIYDYYFSKGAIPIIGIRSCTDAFKVAPQRRYIRQIVGNKGGVLIAQCWLGITTDEERRRSESQVKWCGLTYPLLDDHRVNRQECIERLLEEGLDVGKSGCFHCPYAGSKFYKALRADHPHLFTKALELELNAERTWKAKGNPLTVGIMGGRKLQLIDELDLPDSVCDGDAGCFI